MKKVGFTCNEYIETSPDVMDSLTTSLQKEFAMLIQKQPSFQANGESEFEYKIDGECFVRLIRSNENKFISLGGWFVLPTTQTAVNQLITLCKTLHFYMPNIRIQISNLTDEPVIFQSVKKKLTITDERAYWASFGYAFAHAWISLYPPKKARDLLYLPLPDEIYLKIPAHRVERLDNGSIMVMQYPDLTASVEEKAKYEVKIVKYYQKILKDFGIYNKVFDEDGWRIIYKDILQEKGLFVDLPQELQYLNGAHQDFPEKKPFFKRLFG